MDTGLFVTSVGETKEDSTFVCFTESKDKEVRLCVLRDVHVQKHFIFSLNQSPIYYLFSKKTCLKLCDSAFPSYSKRGF